jgi:hypothetical protein
MMERILILLLLVDIGVFPLEVPPTGCELRDGDCPTPCPSGQGTHAATPTLNISGLCEVHGQLCRPSAESFSVAADAADEIIREHAKSSADIVIFDNTHRGLHTSVLYTCCHTSKEVKKLRGVSRVFFKHVLTQANSISRPDVMYGQRYWTSDTY